MIQRLPRAPHQGAALTPEAWNQVVAACERANRWAAIPPLFVREDAYGFEVRLDQGGLGSIFNLTDPGGDRILFWDDSAGSVTWLSAGTGITISGTTINRYDPRVCEGRLTLESGVTHSLTDQTAKGTLYFTPMNGTGSRVVLYSGSAWAEYSLTERSLALAGLVANATNYDVWIYDNSGTLTLELTAWTNDTTRATALATVNGVYVKSGTTTRRYLGTIRGSAAGQCEDSLTKRFVWNYYNRANRYFYKLVTSSHTYSTATWRAWNNDTGNRFGYVCGVLEDWGHFGLHSDVNATTGGDTPAISVSLDGAVPSQRAIHSATTVTTIGVTGPVVFTAAGYHYLEAQEYAGTGGGTFDKLIYWSTFWM